MMGHDQTLEDDQLVEKLEHAVWEERRRLPELLACLGEVDRRKLPITLGYASTFDYCRRHLRFSEDEAYRRISAARACIGRPQLLSAMAEGRLSLTVVSKLAPHIYREDAPDIIARAEGKTSRGVEELLAPLRPETQKRDLMRSIAVTAPAAAESAAAQFVAGSCAIVVPRVEFTFQGSPELRRALERLRELLAHKFPFGGLEDILSEAVQDYIVRHDPQRGLALVKPAPVKGSTALAAALRRAVWARDGGRCTFTGEAGRCTSRRMIEIDHIRPRALGGLDRLENLRLLCRAHNDAERRRILGEG